MNETIKLFAQQPINIAAAELVNKLGFQCVPTLGNVAIDDFFKQNDFTYRYLNDIKDSIEHIWDIGYVYYDSYSQHLEDKENKYLSLEIFACEIKSGVKFTRPMAANLTRAFNRISTRSYINKDTGIDMPVIVIMKQVTEKGTLLSIGTCERSERKDGTGDKVGKVTMLRNMNCEKLHPGHRQILERIANEVSSCSRYDELYQKWFKSFSIDILSDEFFRGYKAIYEDIIEYVTGKRMVQEEPNKWVEQCIRKPCTEIMEEFAGFPNPEKAVHDYVKNLMGRLVFIQFLQKKGWMGVPAGDSWNGGDPDFLQNLFGKSDKKQTFIDDVLEPLFNDLNTKRHGDLVTNQNVGVDIKVPYLNGGLFELDKSDDTKFPLPGHFMKDLLDFFASYNFTIDECAPDDVEIGVDPEMLGRIFENLLEDNKEKGAFYTPKEIVRYMCRESLISYLTTCIIKKQGDNHKPERKIKDAIRQLLSEPEIVVPKMTPEHLKDFGDYIRNVKICDPAIGSGAFPMGLLNELFHCRKIIKAWAKDSYGNILVNDFAALKADIICNNIYGVDIEKGAIDIARLRFWLSIIVDLKTPHALPNFDYKFMQGNSLMTTFNNEYVNLDTKNQKHIKVKEMKSEKQTLYDFKQKYFGAQGVRKQELAVEIKKSILRLVSMQVGYELRAWYQKNVTQTSLNFEDPNNIAFEEIKNKLPKDRQEVVSKAEAIYKQLNDISIDISKRAQIDINFFDWRMIFTEVFDNEDGNGGFDIVIGNPPYIQLQANEGYLANIYQDKGFETFNRSGDIFSLFYEQGWNLLKRKGDLCYITSNKWMRNKSGKETRQFFSTKTNPKLIYDFAGIQLFENATVETNIIILSKEDNEQNTFAITMHDNTENILNNLEQYSIANGAYMSFDDSDDWVILSPEEAAIQRKIAKKAIPLKNWNIEINFGIKTGYNTAFIIEKETRQALLENCCCVDERKRTDSLIVPVIRGRDTSRYLFNWAELWLINTHNGLRGEIPPVDINLFPSLKNYLDKYWDNLQTRCDKGITPYNLRNCAYLKEFTKPKIIWGEISDRSKFCFDETGQYFCEATTFFMTGEISPFLLCYLNSKLSEYLFSKIATRTGMGTTRWKKYKIEKLLVPRVSKEMEQQIEELYCQYKISLNEKWLDQIDNLIYDFFELDEKERVIVNSND